MLVSLSLKIAFAGRKSYARDKRNFVPTVKLLVKVELATIVNCLGLFINDES